MKNRRRFNLLLVILIIIISMTGTGLEAQVVKVDSTSNWKKAFKSGLSINQSAFSTNWKAGG